MYSIPYTREITLKNYCYYQVIEHGIKLKPTECNITRSTWEKNPSKGRPSWNVIVKEKKKCHVSRPIPPTATSVKGGIISEGIFSLVSFSLNKQNHFLSNFPCMLKRDCDSMGVFFEDGIKLKYLLRLSHL